MRQLKFIGFVKKQNNAGLYPNQKQIHEWYESLIDTMFFDGEYTGTSSSTFSRDLKSIRGDFHIDLQYDRKEKGYKIEESDISENWLNNMTEAFEVLSSLELESGFPDFIISERRKSLFDYSIFHSLIRYIKEQKTVKFDYQKYDSGEILSYDINPIALKENERRWYLIGTRKGTNELRAFGLDRIKNLIANGKRERNLQYNPEKIKEVYQDCFAMFYTDAKAEEVILEFDNRDFNYVQSFPIHHSQKTLSNNQVRLNIKITEDFVQELLSRAWSVKVIQPQSLRKRLYKIFKEAVKRNEGK